MTTIGSAVVGHAAAIAQVPDPLPPTLLLVGPEGVGKRRVASVLARRTGVSGADFQNLATLDRAAARSLIEFHATAPLDGPVKITVADLTGATPEAVNAILKVLEEPPPYSRIILHADTEPLLTIRSRCFPVRFGLLSEAEVATVLDRLEVVDPREAARYAQGRVSVGLAYAGATAARAAAEAVLVAVARHDPAQVEAALHRALLPDADDGEEADFHRLVLCRLLSQSLRTSLTTREHALAHLPLRLRREALDILEGRSRPLLRARAATWVLMAD